MSANSPVPDDVPHMQDEIVDSSTHLLQQQAIIQITKQALESSNLNQLLLESVEMVCSILGMDFGEVLQVNLEQNQLTYNALVGCPEELQQALPSVQDIEPGSLYEFVLRNPQPVISSNLTTEQRFNLPEMYQHSVINSCMCAAIQGKDLPYGILSVFSSKTRVFSKNEINFIQKIANLIALVVDLRRMESSLVTSQGELAFILDGIAEGITVQVAGGELVYANDMAARLLGFKNREHLLSIPITEVMSGIQIFYENGEIMPTDQFQGRRVLQGEDKVSGVNRVLLMETGVERWLLINSAAVTDVFKQERMAVNIFQDITPIKQNESDQKYLAALSGMLATPVTLEQLLQNIVDMAIQHFADWCVVHLAEEDGEVRQMAVANKDPQKNAITLELQTRYPPDKTSSNGVYQVIRSGKGEFFPDISKSDLELRAPDEKFYKILMDLGLHSAMILPLIARGHTLGTITFVWAESKQTYTERDINLAQELAQRAALAIDNVSLYQEARTLNEELENKVHKRTAQLQRMNTKLEGEIVEKIQAQHELERNRALFSDLFEMSPDAIFLVEQSGNILRANARAAEIFGYEKNELIGSDIEQLIPEHARKVHIEHRTKYQAEPQRRTMGTGYELQGSSKNGDKFPVDVMLSPVKIGDDWLVISVVRDITDQKRSQAEIAEVQHRLLDSQEAERLMLAQEIHDGTIQELFSIIFQLAEFKNKVSKAGMPELAEKIKNASEMTQKVIQGLRNISRDLRPPALAPFGLEQAIYSHLERFHELHPDIEIHTDISPDGQRLEESFRLVMFRIYQNAVNNIARHAEASQLWVHFDLNDKQVSLEIEDNGKGFIVPERWVELVRQGHLGLVGIRERVEAIGGNLTIVSAPGKGTLIRVIVPF